MASRITRQETVRRLRDAQHPIMPSLLLCDFGDLGSEVRRVEAAGVPAMHLDVMDGNFVPNLTYGMPIAKAVRRLTDLPIEAHLMIEQPQRYVKQFYEAGVDLITIHAEAVDDPRPVLEEIRSVGAATGLAINLPTPVVDIAKCLPLCDLVLVMSVMTGFGGQKFDPQALEKIRELATLDDNLLLEVDGGVNDQTIGSCAEAGANLFSVGSVIFASDDYSETIHELSRHAQAGSKLCSQR